MKVYGDRLFTKDLHEAARIASVGIDTLEMIPGARVRACGWKVKLTGSSTRHRNSGRHGAATWADTPPATWDEHGRWMAELFERDPDARIEHYNGRDDFNRQTDNRYARVTT